MALRRLLQKETGSGKDFWCTLPASVYVIRDSFGVQDPGQLSWNLAAFSLTVGTFILPLGEDTLQSFDGV